MKKTLKILLWTIGTISAIFLFGAFIFSLDYLKATRIRQASESEAINDSVWCIKDSYVNAYLFKGKTGYVMIDAGIDKKSLVKELDKFNIKPKKISAVFLTYTDEDHIGSLSLFKNAVIYMSGDEEQLIKGKTKYNKPRWKYGAYTILKNNDSLSVDGLKVKIYLNPGHSSISSYYIIGTEYLAAGDNLIVKNKKYEASAKKQEVSVERDESIKSVPDPARFKYILTAHYGFVKE